MRHEESKHKYRGVLIAVPTPMHEDETLDLPRLRELIHYYRESGLAEGNCVCTVLGAGGEAMHLDESERRAVAETAVQAANGEIPVFIGVGHTRTRTAVELARHADRVGADGLHHLTWMIWSSSWTPPIRVARSIRQLKPTSPKS